MRRMFFLWVIMLYALSLSAQAELMPIALDKDIMSGFNLNPIQVPWADKDRDLRAANLFKGKELIINTLSSNTAAHKWEDFPLDEFIFVINGQAVISNEDGSVQKFNKGNFFMLTKGFKGTFETVGGDSFFIGFAVTSLKRAKTKTTQFQDTAYPIDPEKLSGIGIGKDQKEILASATELEIAIISKSNSIEKIENLKGDKFIQVLSGKTTIKTDDGQTRHYFTNDFFVIPKGFKGSIQYEGHSPYRELVVYQKQ